ncbi:MAG: DUF2169 domain-containing protein, partial [Desulfobacteraceae bacterium]|nr:DUF2169 domain-containing protein [Desulfobacteraceae bacterium]
MRIYRPLQISFNHQVLEQSRKFYFTASATLGIDLQTGGELLDLNYLKDVFEGMGENALPDMGMPKPNGEFLVSGSFFAPDNKAVTGGEVMVRLGEYEKKLIVFGQRKWEAGLPSNPQEITSMPLDFIRAFGGEGYEKNPDGIGFNDGLLPCIENPRHLVASKTDKPEPAAFSPLYPMLPQRMKYQGTYDSDYKKKYFPGYPEDHDWKFFMCASQDQWIKEFFTGDEAFTLYHMNPDVPKIEGNLPGLVARCFINQIKENKETFAELTLNLDTVWFFPEKMLALKIFRGVIEVEDDEAETINDVLCAYEDKSEPARSMEYYRKAFEKRKHSEDALLTNLNTQDLIPDGHKSAMELLMETGLANADDEENALIKNMDAKADIMRKKADDDIEKAIQQSEDNMKSIDIPDEGRVDIRKMIKEPSDTKLDPDVEKLNQKLEAILPGITANDPKKLELKNFSFDKIDELTDVFDEFSDKKKKAAKDLAKEEIQKVKEQLRNQIESIDNQIENIKGKKGSGDLSQVDSLENTKKQTIESLKPFEKIDLDGKLKASKGPLPRIDIEQIKAQSQQIDPRIVDAMQHFQSMKATGAEEKTIKAMEKQIQETMESFTNQLDKRLQDAEEGFKEGYILSAHFMGDGLSPHKDSLDNIKKQFLDAVSKGENVSGKDWACIDLAGENIDGIDLSGAFLEQVNFKDASLKGVNFSGAILARANFEDADLSKANFEKANVGGVSALRANFTQANLKLAKLSKGDFSEANFTNANLEEIESLEVVITSANFTKAHMPKINFIETKIDGAKFIETDINTSSFLKCIVTESDFSSSLMGSCAFVDSHLT